jgi:hypothetical protein
MKLSPSTSKQMEEDFYATIKLVSGEEIFSLVCISEEDDRRFLILDNPVIITPIQSKSSRTMGYKVVPWVNISDDEMFILNFDKVLTMTEIKDANIISIYKRFNRPSAQVQVTKQMGLISKVDSARETLERLYKSN